MRLNTSHSSRDVRTSVSSRAGRPVIRQCRHEQGDQHLIDHLVLATITGALS